MPSTIPYSVHSYVDEWLDTDREARGALIYVPGRSYTKDLALEHLGNFMRVYGIARNFPAAYGGAGESLLDLIEQSTFNQDVNEAYVAFFRSLKVKYGRNLYSAASKLLWLRFGSPFRLYDRFADKWLRRKGKISTSEVTWYGEYCDLWQQQFEQHQEEIRDECVELSKAKRFFVPSTEDEIALETVLRETWFHERVFDHFISWPEV
jgi:hypothetical protein